MLYEVITLLRRFDPAGAITKWLVAAAPAAAQVDFAPLEDLETDRPAGAAVGLVAKRQVLGFAAGAAEVDPGIERNGDRHAGSIIRFGHRNNFV